MGYAERLSESLCRISLCRISRRRISRCRISRCRVWTRTAVSLGKHLLGDGVELRSLWRVCLTMIACQCCSFSGCSFCKGRSRLESEAARDREHDEAGRRPIRWALPILHSANRDPQAAGWQEPASFFIVARPERRDRLSRFEFRSVDGGDVGHLHRCCSLRWGQCAEISFASIADPLARISFVALPGIDACLEVAVSPSRQAPLSDRWSNL